MDDKQYKLCGRCQEFDIRELLLAAETAPLAAHARGDRPAVHLGVPKFFAQQPNIQALKSTALGCDLCSAIWREYCRQKQSFELTEEAIAHDGNYGQIYIGTQDWDPSLSRSPPIFVTQQSVSKTSRRQIACFEACASQGIASSLADTFELAAEISRWISEKLHTSHSSVAGHLVCTSTML